MMHPDADCAASEDLRLPGSPEVFEALDSLRSDRPVAPFGPGHWLLLSYEGIVEVVREPDRFGNRPPVLPLTAPRVPLESDPPDHTRYRRLLQPLFSTARTAELAPRIEDATAELLAPVIANGGGDLVPALTHPLPARVLCLMLGFPDEQFADIKHLSDELYHAEWGSTTPDQRRMDAANTALFEHAYRLIEVRRREPLDPQTDIVTCLLGGRIDGGPIPDDIIAGAVRLLLTAGHNSTTNALGNTILHLAQHPDDQQRLRDDPTLIPDAAEELLRLETPVLAMPRYVREATELHGQHLAEDDVLWLTWGAANRDPAAFHAPNEGILDREQNRHLAFGHGVHKCIGLPVARLELRIAMEQLLARTHTFWVEGEVSRPRWPRHGVASLPIRLEAA